MNLLQSNPSCDQKFCMILFIILNSKKKVFLYRNEHLRNKHKNNSHLAS